MLLTGGLPPSVTHFVRQAARTEASREDAAARLAAPRRRAPHRSSKIG